jgi:flavin-dependent dehydrogenase
VAANRSFGVGPLNADPVDILVVGAGPAGLALALQAHDHGARVLIVEQRQAVFRPSRAMILHSRTASLPFRGSMSISSLAGPAEAWR